MSYTVHLGVTQGPAETLDAHCVGIVRNLNLLSLVTMREDLRVSNLTVVRSELCSPVCLLPASEKYMSLRNTEGFFRLILECGMNWTFAFLFSSHPLPPKKQDEENKNLTQQNCFSIILRM